MRVCAVSARPYVQTTYLPRWMKWLPWQIRRLVWMTAQRNRGKIVMLIHTGTFTCQCGEVIVRQRETPIFPDGIVPYAVVPFDERGTEPPICDCCGDTLSQIVSPR